LVSRSGKERERKKKETVFFFKRPSERSGKKKSQKKKEESFFFWPGRVFFFFCKLPPFFPKKTVCLSALFRSSLVATRLSLLLGMQRSGSSSSLRVQHHVQPNGSQQRLTGACLACKKAHHACDQERPKCARCVRLGASCEYRFHKKPGRKRLHVERTHPTAQQQQQQQQSEPVGNFPVEEVPQKRRKCLLGEPNILQETTSSPVPSTTSISASPSSASPSPRSSLSSSQPNPMNPMSFTFSSFSSPVSSSVSSSSSLPSFPPFPASSFSQFSSFSPYSSPPSRSVSSSSSHSTSSPSASATPGQVPNPSASPNSKRLYHLSSPSSSAFNLSSLASLSPLSSLNSSSYSSTRIASCPSFKQQQQTEQRLHIPAYDPFFQQHPQFRGGSFETHFYQEPATADRQQLRFSQKPDGLISMLRAHQSQSTSKEVKSELFHSADEKLLKREPTLPSQLSNEGGGARPSLRLQETASHHRQQPTTENRSKRIEFILNNDSQDQSSLPFEQEFSFPDQPTSTWVDSRTAVAPSGPPIERELIGHHPSLQNRSSEVQPTKMVDSLILPQIPQRSAPCLSTLNPLLPPRCETAPSAPISSEPERERSHRGSISFLTSSPEESQRSEPIRPHSSLSTAGTRVISSDPQGGWVLPPPRSQQETKEKKGQEHLPSLSKILNFDPPESP